MSFAGGEFLRDLVDRLETPPSNDVQDAYLAAHPRPERKPHRKSTSPHHGNTLKLIEVDGVQKSAHAWAKAKGWCASKVHNRINAGWDPVCAVLAPTGMGKEAAHNQFKRSPVFVCPTKSRRKDAPVVQHGRVVPSKSESAVICMSCNRIEFAGSYSLTPEKADELALNLVRMAEDIRKRSRR